MSKEKLPTLSSSASSSINESLAKSAQEGTKARKQSILEKIPKEYHDKRWDNIQQRAVADVKMEQTSTRSKNSTHTSTKMKRAGRSHTR